MIKAICNLILSTISHLKFACICKFSKVPSSPNYLFRVGRKNVGIRKLENKLKGVRD